MKAAQRTVNFVLCMVFCTCLSVYSQSNTAQERVTIKSIVGKAEVRSPQTGKWRPARIGMSVKMKWDVRTFVESSIELQFSTGTTLKLGENSVVNLSTLLQDKGAAATKSNVKVASGQVWANVKKLVSKKSKFSFETPTAVAAIRGTRLRVEVDKSKTVVDVYEGSVSVRNKGSKKVVLVSTRNRAIVQSGEPDIETVNFDDIDTTEDRSEPEDTTAVIDSTEIDTTTETTEEVFLNIESPEDNKIVDETQVAIKGTANPGATIFAGSKQVEVKDKGTFVIAVDLMPGVNKITITAQLGGESKQADITIIYEPPKKLFLTVTQPAEGMKVKTPVIPVQGATVAGAEVTVDDNAVSVTPDGSFTYQVHIPNEAGEYIIQVVSRYKGEETRLERTVIYEPEREKLDLVISSPINGQEIKTNLIRVIGKAVFGARMEITGGGGSFTRTFTVGKDGSFICEIPIHERDIGDYVIEANASVDETGEEEDRVITVEVDVKSANINTSVPRIDITGPTQGASKIGYFTARVTDNTPEDQIMLTVDINGAKDQYTLERSDQEKIILEEGKNRYVIYAVDLAGNKSNALSGEIYYLPGPLVIDIIEPDETQYVIDDLPPMPVNAQSLSMDIEVEIDDGIRDVPETILFCRVNGIVLKETNNYIYKGKIPLKRGVNNFLIEVEDMAANREKKTFTIVINE
ncbi:FecR domain-containing protein [Fibrobacterota bacterium]